MQFCYEVGMNICNTDWKKRKCIRNQKSIEWGFPGDAVVKNLPANAGDTGSSPSPGRSHMPWSD